MDDEVAVQVGKGMCHLSHHFDCLLFLEFSLAKCLLEVAVGEQLADEVDMLLVTEVTVERGNVRVLNK